MKKILLIVGTRPEAIKLSPLIKLLLAEDSPFQPVICHTGQHQELAEEVFSFFGIESDISLGLMQQEPNLARLTAALLTALDQVMTDVRPWLVLVQGDTTSAFAGALSAFYAGYPVGHVEAGLRTYRKRYPFPEEINRTFISRLVDYHFAPTAGARRNLLNEGIPPEKILLSGNTGIDALRLGMELLKKRPPSRTIRELRDRLETGKKMILVTVHRRENHGPPLWEICSALAELAARPDLQVLFPVHPNPQVRNTVEAALGQGRGVILTDPLPYPVFLWAMEQCDLILTDSGGIQEEAVGIKKPVLLLREQTERPEAIESEWVELAGMEKGTILQSVFTALAGKERPDAPNPFGDGRAGERIIAFLNRSGPI